MFWRRNKKEIWIRNNIKAINYIMDCLRKAPVYPKYVDMSYIQKIEEEVRPNIELVNVGLKKYGWYATYFDTNGWIIKGVENGR